MTLTKMRVAGLVECAEAGSQLASVILELRKATEIRDSNRSEIDLVVRWLEYTVWRSYANMLARKHAGDRALEADVLGMVAGIAARLSRVGLYSWFATELDAATSSSTNPCDRFYALDQLVKGLREVFPKPNGLVTAGEARWGAAAPDGSVREAPHANTPPGQV